MEGSKVVWGLGSATPLQPIVYIFLPVETAKEGNAGFVDFGAGLELAVEVFGCRLAALDQIVSSTLDDSVVGNFLGMGSCGVTE